jgi:hypothetical protein
MIIDGKVIEMAVDRNKNEKKRMQTRSETAIMVSEHNNSARGRT